MHTGRMSQTSTERLRDYLAQLPPQAQALLMREFERAIERDEDASVATLVLEQLRKVVRGTDEEAQPRTDDPARLVFRPLEPFLVEGSYPKRPGQIRRASLLPVWQWLIRDGAPEPARELDAALAELRNTATLSAVEPPVRVFQRAAAEAIARIATPGIGGDRRALARVGAPDVIEDLLPIGSILQAARRWTPSMQGFPPTSGIWRKPRSPRSAKRSMFLPCRRRCCCRLRCRW